jgi:hypothetical protein
LKKEGVPRIPVFRKKGKGRRNAKVSYDIPQEFGIDEIRFRHCFSAPSYRIFALLVVGWVLTVGRHSLSQVILTTKLHESGHFATVYRFMDKGRWDPDWVSCCLFRVIVEILIADDYEILVVVDDALNKHRGKHICGAAWQHDGSAPKLNKKSKQLGYGVCFVTIESTAAWRSRSTLS